MHYIVAVGAAGRRYLLRRNATGRVKISLSNWTACPGRRYDVRGTFHPFYTTFFLVLSPRSAREPRRENERGGGGGKRGERAEKPRLIAYRPFVSKVELARPSFYEEAGLFLAGQEYRERGSPAALCLSLEGPARNYCRRGAMLPGLRGMMVKMSTSSRHFSKILSCEW